MKRLIPSLREKKRYLRYKIIGNKISYKDVNEEIKKKMHDYTGRLGMAKAGLIFMNNIIRVNNRFVNELKASLNLVSKINNKDVIVKSDKVSGNLNKVKGGL